MLGMYIDTKLTISLYISHGNDVFLDEQSNNFIIFYKTLRPPGPHVIELPQAMNCQALPHAPCRGGGAYSHPHPWGGYGEGYVQYGDNNKRNNDKALAKQ